MALAGDHLQVLVDAWELTGDHNQISIDDSYNVLNATSFGMAAELYGTEEQSVFLMSSDGHHQAIFRYLDANLASISGDDTLTKIRNALSTGGFCQ